MPRSLITPRRALVAVVLALLVTSFLGEGVGASVAHGPRSMLNTALSPLTHPLYALSRTLRGEARTTHGFDEDRFGRDQLEEELARALRRLEQLRQEHEQLQRAYTHVTQTREQLGLAGVRLVDARVTAYTGDRAAPVLRINRGTRHGIAEQTVIVTGSDLVGRVVHAGPRTADVRLITARGTELQVTIRSPEVAPGDTDDAESDPRRTHVQLAMRDDGRSYTVQVPARSEVAEGDLAQLSDPRWPREARGFFVGRVTSVQPASQDPFAFRDVIVEPIPPLGSLAEVTALVPAE